MAGEPPPQAARPMGKQGFEPPDHFLPLRIGRDIFPISCKNLEQNDRSV
ncbi:hypothetical protein [Mesorhizobium sp.]|nr:hypothetical protein [Mesorhizobium sp.]